MRVPATLIASALVLWLGGCATDRAASQTSAAGLDFALIGDMPYDGRQEKEFANLMKDIDAAELAFVVHNGDFWWDGQAWTEKSAGLPPCSDEAFDDRLALAQRSRHPFIYAPGDNEWVDCHRANPAKAALPDRPPDRAGSRGGEGLPWPWARLSPPCPARIVD